jgi:hypothetical protein
MHTAICFTSLLNRYDGALLTALSPIRQRSKIIPDKRRCDDDLFNTPSPAVDAYHYCLPAHDNATRALAHLPAPTSDSTDRYPIFGAYRAASDDEAATRNTCPFDQRTPGSADVRPHKDHLAHPSGLSTASQHASYDAHGAAQDFSVQASCTKADSAARCADANSGPYSNAAGVAIIPHGRLVSCLLRRRR